MLIRRLNGGLHLKAESDEDSEILETAYRFLENMRIGSRVMPVRRGEVEGIDHQPASISGEDSGIKA